MRKLRKGRAVYRVGICWNLFGGGSLCRLENKEVRIITEIPDGACYVSFAFTNKKKAKRYAKKFGCEVQGSVVTDVNIGIDKKE